MRVHLPLGLLACLSLSAMAGESIAPLSKIGSIDHRPIAEISGMVKSQRFEGVYWVHNDSGDLPRIFAMDRTAKVIMPPFLAGAFHGEVSEEGKEVWPGISLQLAANIDWEDIAILGEYLVIADAGNNGNARRDLGLYFVTEPNPNAVSSSRILKYLPLRYPEQEDYPGTDWHFDSESLFTADGKIYLISKHRRPGEIMGWDRGANLYRLDTQYTDRENLLVMVDSHAELSVATGADLSPDGSKLAVISYTGVWIFDRPRQGDQWLSSSTRRLLLDPRVTRQVEAICWDTDEILLVANENRDFYEVRISDVPAYGR